MMSLADAIRDYVEKIIEYKLASQEYRDTWNDRSPKIVNIGMNIELDEKMKKTVYFLDCKVDNEKRTESMKINKSDNVISRGTQYSYQLYDVDKIDSSFWNGLAMTEMLIGIGDRTSFGKGQIIVS